MNVARFDGGPLDGFTVGISMWPPMRSVSSADVTALMLMDGREIPEFVPNYVLDSKRTSKLSDEQLIPNLARGATYTPETA
jgi:hypothetical protein